MKQSLFTRMLYRVAPKTAYQRDVYRMAGRSLYAAADRGRFNDGWTTVSQANAEAANRGERDILRARARDMERNSDAYNAEILSFERNVVNTGIVLQSRVRRDDGEEDDALNTRIEELWKEWCRPENCDITGRMSFSKLQKLCTRRRFVDGGVLVLKVMDGKSFKLQVLEVDCLDTAVYSWGGNRVVGGIEVNRYNHPVAYHLKVFEQDVHTRTERIPAKQVVFLAHITMPSQVREVTPTAPSMVRINETDDLIQAALMKERVLSYFALFIKRGGLSGGFGRGFGAPGGTSDTGKPIESLEQGMIRYLPPGEEVQSVNPAGSSSTINDVLRTTQRLAGSGVGLSYEAASRDMSQVNYSSARQGLLEDQRTYKDWQDEIENLCESIYQDWMDWMVLSGRLDIPGYWGNKEKYRRHIWVTSGWDWIDPVKEANANKIALETGQKTLMEISAARGKDWREVVAQRKKEMEMLAVKDGEE